MKGLYPMISSLGWQILEVAKDGFENAMDAGKIANALSQDRGAVFNECYILWNYGFVRPADTSPTRFVDSKFAITESGLQALRNRRK
jgi:hypothetical protein